MIKSILIVNNHGKPRIAKFYEQMTEDDAPPARPPPCRPLLAPDTPKSISSDTRKYKF